MKPGNPRIDLQFVGCQFPQRILEDENGWLFPFLSGRVILFKEMILIGQPTFIHLRVCYGGTSR